MVEVVVSLDGWETALSAKIVRKFAALGDRERGSKLKLHRRYAGEMAKAFSLEQLECMVAVVHEMACVSSV